MNWGSHSLAICITLTTLAFMGLAILPALVQAGSADALEGSAGGQADMPAAKGPPPVLGPIGTKEGKVQQAPPDLQHQGPVPLGLTEEERAAEDRANRGEAEPTTKPLRTPSGTPEDAPQRPGHKAIE